MGSEAELVLLRMNFKDHWMTNSRYSTEKLIQQLSFILYSGQIEKDSAAST